MEQPASDTINGKSPIEKLRDFNTPPIEKINILTEMAHADRKSSPITSFNQLSLINLVNSIKAAESTPSCNTIIECFLPFYVSLDLESQLIISNHIINTYIKYCTVEFFASSFTFYHSLFAACFIHSMQFYGHVILFKASLRGLYVLLQHMSIYTLSDDHISTLYSSCFYGVTSSNTHTIISLSLLVLSKLVYLPQIRDHFNQYPVRHEHLMVLLEPTLVLSTHSNPHHNDSSSIQSRSQPIDDTAQQPKGRGRRRKTAPGVGGVTAPQSSRVSLLESLTPNDIDNRYSETLPHFIARYLCLHLTTTTKLPPTTAGQNNTNQQQQQQQQSTITSTALNSPYVIYTALIFFNACIDSHYIDYYDLSLLDALFFPEYTLMKQREQALSIALYKQYKDENNITDNTPILVNEIEQQIADEIQAYHDHMKQQCRGLGILPCLFSEHADVSIQASLLCTKVFISSSKHGIYTTSPAIQDYRRNHKLNDLRLPSERIISLYDESFIRRILDTIELYSTNLYTRVDSIQQITPELEHVILSYWMVLVSCFQSSPATLYPILTRLWPKFDTCISICTSPIVSYVLSLQYNIPLSYIVDVFYGRDLLLPPLPPQVATLVSSATSTSSSNNNTNANNNDPTNNNHHLAPTSASSVLSSNNSYDFDPSTLQSGRAPKQTRDILLQSMNEFIDKVNSVQYTNTNAINIRSSNTQQTHTLSFKQRSSTNQNRSQQHQNQQQQQNGNQNNNNASYQLNYQPTTVFTPYHLTSTSISISAPLASYLLSLYFHYTNDKNPSLSTLETMLGDSNDTMQKPAITELIRNCKSLRSVSIHTLNTILSASNKPSHITDNAIALNNTQSSTSNSSSLLMANQSSHQLNMKQQLKGPSSTTTSTNSSSSSNKNQSITDITMIDGHIYTHRPCCSLYKLTMALDTFSNFMTFSTHRDNARIDYRGFDYFSSMHTQILSSLVKHLSIFSIRENERRIYIDYVKSHLLPKHDDLSRLYTQTPDGKYIDSQGQPVALLPNGLTQQQNFDHTIILSLLEDPQRIYLNNEYNKSLMSTTSALASSSSSSSSQSSSATTTVTHSNHGHGHNHSHSHIVEQYAANTRINQQQCVQCSTVYKHLAPFTLLGGVSEATLPPSMMEMLTPAEIDATSPVLGDIQLPSSDPFRPFPHFTTKPKKGSFSSPQYLVYLPLLADRILSAITCVLGKNSYKDLLSGSACSNDDIILYSQGIAVLSFYIRNSLARKYHNLLACLDARRTLLEQHYQVYQIRIKESEDLLKTFDLMKTRLRKFNQSQMNGLGYNAELDAKRTIGTFLKEREKGFHEYYYTLYKEHRTKYTQSDPYKYAKMLTYDREILSWLDLQKTNMQISMQQCDLHIYNALNIINMYYVRLYTIYFRPLETFIDNTLDDIEWTGPGQTKETANSYKNGGDLLSGDAFLYPPAFQLFVHTWVSHRKYIRENKYNPDLLYRYIPLPHEQQQIEHQQKLERQQQYEQQQQQLQAQQQQQQQQQVQQQQHQLQQQQIHPQQQQQPPPPQQQQQYAYNQQPGYDPRHPPQQPHPSQQPPPPQQQQHYQQQPPPPQQHPSQQQQYYQYNEQYPPQYQNGQQLPPGVDPSQLQQQQLYQQQQMLAQQQQQQQQPPRPSQQMYPPGYNHPQ